MRMLKNEPPETKRRRHTFRGDDSFALAEQERRLEAQIPHCHAVAVAARISGDRCVGARFCFSNWDAIIFGDHFLSVQFSNRSVFTHIE